MEVPPEGRSDEPGGQGLHLPGDTPVFLAFFCPLLKLETFEALGRRGWSEANIPSIPIYWCVAARGGLRRVVRGVRGVRG